MLRCLEKEPAARFSSASELAQALLPFASAPIQSIAVALDEVGASVYEPEHMPSDARLPVSYGSLSPLHADLRQPRPELPLRRAWPLALGLVVLSLLLVTAWLQYRDPSLVPRAARAAFATRIELPRDPRLSADPTARAVEPLREPPLLLRRVQLARALPEMERAEPGSFATEALTPDQIRERVENYEAWLRAQGLKRLHGQ